MYADKYRPTSFDGIVGQPTDQIEALVDGKDTPNFLFYGPSGTGKTTTAHVIAQEIQGEAGELMEFNNSDERGIKTVREQIIPATKQSTLGGALRVIFLDEMDNMTTDAQEALRVPMERSRAIFVLACNNRNAVHDALVSRCHEFEFGQLDQSAVRERIVSIAEREKQELTSNHLNMIVSFANGDMRKALQRYNQVVRGVISTDDGDDDSLGSFETKANEYLQGE